jgi:hypothetical protein
MGQNLRILRPNRSNVQVFLLKCELGVLRFIKLLSGASALLGGQQETTEHLLAVLGVAAARETAQVSAQVFEPAFAQIRRAQPVPPVCRKGEERQHTIELLLELLHHFRCGPPPLLTCA